LWRYLTRRHKRRRPRRARASRDTIKDRASIHQRLIDYRAESKDSDTVGPKLHWLVFGNVSPDAAWLIWWVAGSAQRLRVGAAPQAPLPQEFQSVQDLAPREAMFSTPGCQRQRKIADAFWLPQAGRERRYPAFKVTQVRRAERKPSKCPCKFFFLAFP
jgi:hypothetical protein